MSFLFEFQVMRCLSGPMGGQFGFNVTIRLVPGGIAVCAFQVAVFGAPGDHDPFRSRLKAVLKTFSIMHV